MKQQHQIIILGSGLGGMLTALYLAHNNIPTLIVERNDIGDSKFIDDIRTTALNAHSIKFLNKLGLWDELSLYCGSIDDIYVVDNKHPEMLHFTKNIPMGYLIANAKFKKILLHHCLHSKYISLLDSSFYKNIVNGKDTLQINIHSKKHKIPEKTIYSSDLLLVCDSYHSKARAQFFADKINKDYRQTAITFLVKHQKQHKGTAVEHFLPEGPFAILPMKKQNISSIVWSVSTEYSNVLCRLSSDEFEFLVYQNFGPFLGKITLLNYKNPIATFPLKCIIANSYQNNRIALVADTAHIIHPLAGQGLNLGIKDIESLTANIKKLGLTKEALIEYASEREYDNQNMAEITDLLNSVFSNNSKTLQVARRIGLNFIEKTPVLKDFFMNYAMGKR